MQHAGLAPSQLQLRRAPSFNVPLPPVCACIVQTAAKFFCGMLRHQQLSAEGETANTDQRRQARRPRRRRDPPSVVSGQCGQYLGGGRPFAVCSFCVCAFADVCVGRPPAASGQLLFLIKRSYYVSIFE
jgi:hypothetical protein